MTALQSDHGPRLFRDPFFNKWYCWDREWLICHGPFDTIGEAEKAAGYGSNPPNCS